MEERCVTKELHEFLYGISFLGAFQNFAWNMGTKDSFMREQGIKEPPYVTLGNEYHIFLDDIK